MVLGYTSGLMGENMKVRKGNNLFKKVNGKIMICMEKEYIIGVMVENMREIMKMIRNM